MSEERKYIPSSSWKGSNPGQAQLEALRNAMKTLKGITSSFRGCFRGENSRLDSLMDNLNIILEKQSCLKSELGGENSASGLGEISGCSPAVDVELESLKAGLQSIQLQVAAFRALAEDHINLNLLLQNLDAVIAKNSQVLPPSIRIKNFRPQVSSASATIEIIDLETDLLDSTFETFGIKTKNDVAAAVADGIINRNSNPESAPAGDPNSVVSASTENSATPGVASQQFEDVEGPTCSSFFAPRPTPNRKRKTDSKVTVDSRANVASKTAKVVIKPRRASSSTGPSLQNSREDNQIDSEDDLTVENLTEIHYNNVNVGKVEIQGDYNSPVCDQSGEVVQEQNSENSDEVVATDSDVEMSDESSCKSAEETADHVPAPVPAPIPAPVPAPIPAPVPAPIPAPVPAPIPAPVPAPIPANANPQNVNNEMVGLSIPASLAPATIDVSTVNEVRRSVVTELRLFQACLDQAALCDGFDDIDTIRREAQQWLPKLREKSRMPGFNSTFFLTLADFNIKNNQIAQSVIEREKWDGKDPYDCFICADQDENGMFIPLSKSHSGYSRHVRMSHVMCIWKWSCMGCKHFFREVDQLRNHTEKKSAPSSCAMTPHQSGERKSLEMDSLLNAVRKGTNTPKKTKADDLWHQIIRSSDIMRTPVEDRESNIFLKLFQ